MNYQLDFKNKSVIVTGAAGGIGLECVKGFLQCGADVYMADYNEKELLLQAARLRHDFPEARLITIRADITSPKDIDKIIGAVKENTGRADVLINNAGISRQCRSTEETPEQWSRVMSINLDGHFFVTQAVVRELMTQGGSIVNTCSLGGITGIPTAAAYSASKGALLQLTKSLAAEWGQLNINVNCVCPGFVETPLIADNLANEKWTAYITKRTPMGRLAKSEDVAGSILFLSSHMAKHITGSSIIIDGGFSCG